VPMSCLPSVPMARDGGAEKHDCAQLEKPKDGIKAELQKRSWPSSSWEETSTRESSRADATEAGIAIGEQSNEFTSTGGQTAEESRAAFVQHFRERFGEEGRVQVQVLERFGSYRHAQVKLNGDQISLHGEDITSFLEFPQHANHLFSSTWSEDLRYFIVFVDGYMTMVELRPEATFQPNLERELNLICLSGIIKALQTAKRRGDFECDPDILIELIQRTRQFTTPFLKKPLTVERFLALQRVLGTPYFENPVVSEKGAEAIVSEYCDIVFAPSRSAQFWNRAGLIEAIAFMDFDCALKCFEAGIQVAEDDATEAMLCANWGQVSGESMVANFLVEACTKKTLKYLNRAQKLDPRFVGVEYGFPLLLKPWLLYAEDTLRS